MNAHPNAIVGGAGGGAGLGTLLVWLLTRYTSVDLSPEAAAGIAGGIATIILFLGRNGLKGAWKIVWGGSTPKKSA